MAVIKFPSDVGRVREASTKIIEALKKYRVSEDVLFDVKLSAEEAIKNAILHGNRSAKKLSITVSYRIEGDKITIEIEDEGGGFKHEDVPDPTEGTNLTRPSGRGVYLMKRLMDSVRYNETGNKVTLVKKIK